MIKTRFKRCNASFFVYSPIHTSRNGLVPSFENGLKFTEKLTLALSLLAGGSEFDWKAFVVPFVSVVEIFKTWLGSSISRWSVESVLREKFLRMTFNGVRKPRMHTKHHGDESNEKWPFFKACKTFMNEALFTVYISISWPISYRSIFSKSWVIFAVLKYFQTKIIQDLGFLFISSFGSSRVARPANSWT